MLELFSKGFVLLTGFGKKDAGSLVRLMATEYSQEYKNLIKNGIMVNDDVAYRFLSAQRKI